MGTIDRVHVKFVMLTYINNNNCEIKLYFSIICIAL